MNEIEKLILIAESVMYCPYCGIETHESHYCKVCGERFVLAVQVPEGFIKHMKENIKKKKELP